MLSFLAAFVLPMSLMFGYLDYKNRELLTREIYDIKDAAVSYMRRTMDFEYSRYRTFSAMLLNNADINRLRRLDYEDITPSDTLRLKNLRSVLSSFSADPSVVSRIFLYMPTNGLYVDSVRALPIDDALYTLEDAGLMPLDDALWQSMLSGRHISRWLGTENQRNGRLLYYVQTVPSAFDADPCNLIVALSPTYLEAVFDVSSLSQNEWIGMLDEDGQVIYSPLGDPPPIDLAQMENLSGHYIYRDQLVTFSRSEISQSYYFSVVPLSSITNTLKGARGLSYIVLLISFFILTIITYLTTVNNFKPIAYLNALAKPDVDDPDIDEFTRLRISLMEAGDEKRMRMDRAKYAQALAADQRLLRDMLKAGNQAPLDKRMQREQLTPVGSAWLLLSVTVVDFSDDEVDTQTAYQRSMTQAHDLISTAVAQFYTVLPLYDDKRLLVLINLPSDELQHLAYLNTSLTNFLQILRGNFSIDCQIAISAIHTRPVLSGEALSAMLTEIQIASDIPTEGESILLYSAQAADKVLYISVEHTMNRLIHACMRGASAEARQLLGQLNEQVESLTESPPKPEGETGIDEEDSTEMRLKRSILEIVKNEYPNPMLNVSAIADHLGKNVDYISRVFKQTTTIGLLDYIHHMRIKAAKDLLIHQPNLSVAQISQRVGYFGADSFIRSFKRIEGTTPGRYRTQHKGE